MKQKRINLVFVISLFISIPAISQDWTLSGNTVLALEWFGASNTSTSPVRIQHRALNQASDIEFYTQNTFRGIMTESGRMGWGLNTPVSQFHLNNSSGECFLYVTNNTSGSSATDGLRLGINSGSGEGELRQYENTALSIYQGNFIRQRFINGGTWNGLNGASAFNASRVSLPLSGVNLTPYSILHMGTQGASNWSRVWMNVGTSYSANNDGMYVGLMERPTAGNVDRTDAVIAWADDPTGSNLGDNLRFIFLRPLGQSGIAGNVQGLEVGRFDPNGNLGVGNFSPDGLNVQPSHKIDVDGTARLRKLELVENAKCIVVGQDGLNPLDNVLFRIDFNGQQNEYLGGDAQWHPVAAGVQSAQNGTSVDGSNNVVLGNDVGNVNAQLTNNREIPLNNFNILFTDANATTPGANRLGIGTLTPTAKLEVVKNLENNNDVNSPAARFTHSDIDGVGFGIQGTAVDVLSNGANFFNSGVIAFANGAFTGNVGIEAGATGQNGAGATGVDITSTTASGNSVGVNGIVNSTAGQAIGASFVSTGITQATGGIFTATGGMAPIGFGNIGIDVTTTGNPVQVSASQNAAGRFVMNSGGPATNYGIDVSTNNNNNASIDFGIRSICTPGNTGALAFGIFAQCTPASNNNPPTGPNYAGWFQGDLAYTGGFGQVSDVNLKHNIQGLENCLNIIDQLHPVSYQFNTEAYPDLGLQGGTHCGFIAQEVEEILPDLIMPMATVLSNADSDDGIDASEIQEFKGLQYIELIPILVKGIQEQNDVISNLQAQLNECCSTGFKSEPIDNNHEKSVKLSSAPSPILYQNTPNPHQGQTVIRYFLPENSGYAEMHFFDTQGQVIRIEALGQTGMGQVNVDASDLASGVYTYALLINGKVIDMKKMVKE